MAIYAANNLFRAISKYAPSGGARLGGVIGNSVTAAYARPLIDDFASITGTRAVGYVPRATVVAQSELHGKTVIEAHPDSAQANVYRKLANEIAGDETGGVIPKPLAVNDLRTWARKWGDLILKTEEGVIQEQAGI